MKPWSCSWDLSKKDPRACCTPMRASPSQDAIHGHRAGDPPWQGGVDPVEVLAVLSTPARVGSALSGRRLGGAWVAPQRQGGQGQVQIPLSWRVTASVHSEASATVICIGHHGSSQADPPVPCLLRAPVAKRPRSGCRQHGSPQWRGEGAAHLRSRASPRRAWPAGGGGTGASPPQSRAPGPPCRPGPPSRHRTVRGRRGHSLALPGCEFRGGKVRVGCAGHAYTGSGLTWGMT